MKNIPQNANVSMTLKTQKIPSGNIDVTFTDWNWTLWDAYVNLHLCGVWWLVLRWIFPERHACTKEISGLIICLVKLLRNVFANSVSPQSCCRGKWLVFFSGWVEALVSVAWQVVEKDIVGSLSTLKETWSSLWEWCWLQQETYHPGDYWEKIH